jgi:ribosomal protein S27E
LGTHEAKTEEVRCPRCHRNDIVPSKPRGILDDIMFGMGRVPRHCRSCGKRFYIPAPPGEGPASGEDESEKEKGAGA